ncbi:hypothetical protein B5F12_04100 [Pseudoflavonifractor sp. An176]|uniref:vWA domain-containing protein n=1 Tax=Pseudoflavonifractor sp. An176 TaxID=1965572 RepID=UPI000B38EA20|nr:vWA domain-containing protein [Pseudoflavonifractor sp. An176]OUP65187.1 hypothetical protein B5F12_04100 [Pseudoflavonifractor sp. An176]
MSDQWNTDFSHVDGDWKNGIDTWGSAIAEMDTGWSSVDGANKDSRDGTRVFHWRMLVSALIGALVGTVVGLVLYDRLYDSSGSNILLVGGICGILVGLILMACVICELINPCLTVDRQVSMKHVGIALAAAVVTFLLMCVCEFIYEMDSAYTVAEFNDYIFVVDDSGSMSSSDPNNLRYSAMENLLDSMGQDKRVGLIRFTEQPDAAPIQIDYLTPGHKERLEENIQHHQSTGGTDIQTALEQALDMYRQSALSGRHPVVVLLSDGGSFVNVSGVAHQYLKEGVAISTVALGPGASEELLQQLAQATGGQYFQVEEADGLVTAFQQVNRAVSYRCLFAPRPGPQRDNVLYMVLRVVFLLLPAMLVAAAVVILFSQRGIERQFVVSAVAGLLSGLLMELGMYWFLPQMPVRAVCWILYGIVTVFYIYRNSGVYQTGLKERNFGGGNGAFQRMVDSQKNLTHSELQNPQDITRDELNRNDDWGV